MAEKSKYELVDLEINKKIIGPGESSLIRTHIGRLPSGTRININAHVFRSELPGPTLLVLGGLHGDEINGVQIVRQAIDKGLFSALHRGSVIAIPVLNIYGFLNFSREVPDGKDVNRSFPGNMKGSLASRIARTVTKKILPAVDIGLDFHTGGAARYNYPQIRYTSRDKRGWEYAQAFAPPVILSKGTIPKSLRKTARGMKIPFLVYEGGESLRLDGIAIEKALEGLRRLLNHLEMASFETLLNHPVLHFRKTSWIRASQAGLFTWTKSSGQRIRKGERIGVIHDPYGTLEVDVLATRDGYLIGHNNAPVVNQGDALFHVGYKEEILSE